MNPLVSKYGPPLAVLGAAFYLVSPESKPLDLGEEPTRARAVRWKPSDLQSPVMVDAKLDPFKPVLVDHEAEAKAAEVAEILPTAEILQELVELSGMAAMNGMTVAFINGKAATAGKKVSIDHSEFKQCKLVQINRGSVVVECRGIQATIRPQVSRPKTQYTPSAKATPVSANPQAAPIAPDLLAEPPQA